MKFDEFFENFVKDGLSIKNIFKAHKKLMISITTSLKIHKFTFLSNVPEQQTLLDTIKKIR